MNDTTDAKDSVKGDTKRLVGQVASGFLILLGVVLPCFTLGFELVTRACAETLFDPAPTVLHVVLVASVPVVNALALVTLWRRKRDWITVMGWASGFTIGVASYYALMFLPVSPFAVMGILFFGFGLLPLSPLISLICAIILRRKMRALAPGPRLQGLWYGVTLAVVALILIEAPKTITEVGLQMAVSEQSDTRSSGIRMLRRFGSRKALLRACYVHRGDAMDPVGFILSQSGRRVSTADARTVYYRVTGEPFNAVKPPASIHGRGFWRDFDPDVAGDEVRGRIRDLEVQESRLDVSADPDAALWYGEWTLVFKNGSFRQQEARALVALPPGGVVSRLTLWIDGEEREAAFGTRSQVKEAYRKVVRRRRDPVLVTTAGQDRVLVQCFPVPPDGGTMKIRIGITAPLTMEVLDHGYLQMPYFVERNFNVPEDLAHTVWAEADRALRPTGSHTNLIVEQPEADMYAVRGSLNGTAMDTPVVLRANRPENLKTSWTLDPHHDRKAILQRLELKTVQAPPRLVIVVDGSRKMEPFADALANTLISLPDGIELALFVAADEVDEAMSPAASTAETRTTLAEVVRSADFVGGCDNVPALERAWDLAAATPGGAILWLHATQPMELQAVEGLRQRWERRKNGPVLYGLQFGTGPNRIVRQLSDVREVQRLTTVGDSVDALRGQCALWAGERERVVPARIQGPALELPADQETSAHLARLWAAGKIDTLLAAGTDQARERAVTMATTYQLVTPVSGAVVLETAQQYQEAGLEPVSSSSVPTIPEPETWMMLILVACMMIGLFVRARLRARRSVR